jgi:ribonuclease P protein component
VSEPSGAKPPHRHPLPPLRQREAFERALRTPPLARSAHFALHHERESAPLAVPGRAGRVSAKAMSADLSTAQAPASTPSVDNIVDKVCAPAEQAAPMGPSVAVDEVKLLGLVIPKRHAPRAATRNLIKRQARQGVLERQADLAPGHWVLRLKSPFERKTYPSGASDPLRAAARAEINLVLGQAIQRQAQRAAQASQPKPAAATPATAPGLTAAVQKPGATI